MAPKAEIKTESLQINSPALWIKLTREFGFPTLVAIALAVGWGADRWYFMSGMSKSQARIERRTRHIETNVGSLMQQKGFHVDPCASSDDDEDDKTP